MPRIPNSKIMTPEQLKVHKQILRRRKYEKLKQRIDSLSQDERDKLVNRKNEINREYHKRKFGFTERQSRTKEERSAYKVAWAKAKRQRARMELLDRYGGRCVCCGASDYRWLTLHHINKDGGSERNHRRLNAANRLYYLVKQPKRDDLELLCYNCHLARDFFGLCPHQDTSSPYFIPSENK